MKKTTIENPKELGVFNSLPGWAGPSQARPETADAGEVDGAHDRLYADRSYPVEPFRFDERVARVFPDMIARSVPGYATVLGAVGLLATRFVQPGSACYDLGCSLGAVSRALRPALAGRAGRIVAVDNSPAMLEAARQTVPVAGDPPIEFVLADVRDAAIADASVVVLNYTLQFVPPADRLDLLRRIRRGLRPGGVLILSEKICFPDRGFDTAMTAAHEAFKYGNGYSALEISRKRAALERVLVPETLDAHRDRLAAAGFRASEVWFQCLNFASLLATT